MTEGGAAPPLAGKATEVSSPMKTVATPSKHRLRRKSFVTSLRIAGCGGWREHLSMPQTTSMFAGYPAPHVYAEPGGKKVQQLLWGDWIEATSERAGGYRRVTKARNSSGWMREEDLQRERLLEVNFIDVGQGDGCFIVTPDDRFIVIDAGQHDNLFWYLRWRFNLRDNPHRVIHIDHAVITHPDVDHYGGFAALFASPQFTIGTLHHNGIVERTGDDRFGPEVVIDGRRYLANLVESKSALKKLLRDDLVVGRMPYPTLLRSALGSGRVDDVRMLSARDGFLDLPSGDLSIQVLGPVPETLNRKRLLRRLGSDGVTRTATASC